MNSYQLKRWSLALLIGASLCLARAQEETNTAPIEETVRVAQPAPAFTLKDLNGGELKLSDFNGKALIVVFWATWDEFCRKQVPTLIELQQEHRAEGFSVIGIAVDDKGPAVVKEFVKFNGVNFPVVMTDLKVIKDFGGLTHVPTSYVIDKNHNIIQKHLGRVDKDVFEADLKIVLKK